METTTMPGITMPIRQWVRHVFTLISKNAIKLQFSLTHNKPSPAHL